MYPDCKISNNLKCGGKVRYYMRVKIVPVCVMWRPEEQGACEPSGLLLGTQWRALSTRVCSHSPFLSLLVTIIHVNGERRKSRFDSVEIALSLSLKLLLSQELFCLPSLLGSKIKDSRILFQVVLVCVLPCSVHSDWIPYPSLRFLGWVYCCNMKWISRRRRRGFMQVSRNIKLVLALMEWGRGTACILSL